MMKNGRQDAPAVLWLGSGECRAAAGMYGGMAEAVFSESADILYSGKKFAAAVLVPESDDFLDSELFREVCRYSSEKRRTVLFIGTMEQLFAAYTMFPEAMLRRVSGNELQDALNEPPAYPSDTHTAAIFSASYEIPAFIEDMIEDKGLTDMNAVFVHARFEGVEWLLRHKVKPDLLIFCGEVLLSGTGLADAIRMDRSLRKKPYIVLHYSDKAPYAGDAPLAVLDIRKDGDKLAGILESVHQGKLRRP